MHISREFTLSSNLIYIKRDKIIKIGRPSKLTKETLESLEEAFTSGLTDEEACSNAGIGQTTYYRWREKKDKAEFRDFWQLTQTWKCEGRFRLRKVIYDAAEAGDWKAAAAMLEKIDPNWRHPQALEITINDNDKKEHWMPDSLSVKLNWLLEEYPEVKMKWLKILEEECPD